ncbi:succinate dehydrogenase [Cyanobium sp. WAJ14-Wanaka]|uniref:succinate dehydrogenase n=1 Tax=Cyanobium sp. WAJ14-Wanaka TaxID=2823725 RepID=UPI0020CDB092|nr:succinate dehydrogenase [Cyanobium sp. WAJ14-Wanaka]MCP9774637.1 succinate dehydrogenase [Cyanobium sp. WAJ14-Wanaka]
MIPSAVAPWIARSGLFLVLFLLLHLAGVSLALLQPTAFEAYATSLHQSPWLLPAEGLLTAALLGHLTLTAVKVMANRRAGNRAQLVSRRPDGWGALAARSLPLSAGILLLFMAVHLWQLRWPRPPAGLELARLLEVLSTPWSLLLYGLAGLAAGFHLFHGGEAAHRSLGLLDPANAQAIRLGSRLVALLVGGGFALVPVLLSGRAAGWLG